MKDVISKYGDEVRVIRPRKNMDVVINGTNEFVTLGEIAEAIATSAKYKTEDIKLSNIKRRSFGR